MTTEKDLCPRCNGEWLVDGYCAECGWTETVTESLAWYRAQAAAGKDFALPEQSKKHWDKYCRR